MANRQDPPFRNKRIVSYNRYRRYNWHIFTRVADICQEFQIEKQTDSVTIRRQFVPGTRNLRLQLEAISFYEFVEAVTGIPSVADLFWKQ